MTQDYEMLGKASDELEAVVAERQGWEDQPRVEPLGVEMSDGKDYSFWDRRANRQALGLNTLPGNDATFPMAGHEEPPMAGQDAQPFTYHEVQP